MGDDYDEAASTSPAESQTRPQQQPAAAEHGVESVKRQLCRLIASSLSATVPGLDVEPMFQISKPGFADYPCNNAMSLFSSLQGSATDFQNPRTIGQAILNNLPASDIVESASVAGSGCVNIVISSYVAPILHPSAVPVSDTYPIPRYASDTRIGEVSEYWDEKINKINLDTSSIHPDTPPILPSPIHTIQSIEENRRRQQARNISTTNVDGGNQNSSSS